MLLISQQFVFDVHLSTMMELGLHLLQKHVSGG